MSSHLRFFSPATSAHASWKTAGIEKGLAAILQRNVKLTAEHCYHIVLKDNVDSSSFESSHWPQLQWLLSEDPFQLNLSKESTLTGHILEVGPRLTFKTAFCTNALSALAAAGIDDVIRIEKTTRYGGMEEGEVEEERFLEMAGDRMTEFIYPALVDFSPSHSRDDFFEIDILGDANNLNKANEDLGLAFDSSDLDYYRDLFVNKLKRNPTDVELFDLAQSDSEHSRHWFFRGKLVVDGKERQGSLMRSIRDTQEHSNKNNLIAFCDNSSAISGFPSVARLVSSDPAATSLMRIDRSARHIIYSAETHNFPTAVCPFQGATTGTGGRIRDIHATGKGAHEIAGVVGYSFGNLHLPGYEQPWEKKEPYPAGFSHPRQIAVEASNGASDYGNKFGEPVLTGFARSFGMRLESGDRSEYVKPILFSGGIGAIDDDQTGKDTCTAGMLLAKIGGPVYRIGVGGGAASSLSVQGAREQSLDFGAVQRGDPEMGQKLHRVVRACAELRENNPILSIHDQGAGGNGNVLKELLEGGGATIDADAFQLGDETISARELWTAEYQENDACLVDPTRIDRMQSIARREKCTVSVVGTVTEEQKVVLTNYKSDERGVNPVNFDTKLLGEREKKVFHLTSTPTSLRPLHLPPGLTLKQALDMVLRLPAVASKRYLTCKVDRSVTGLVARQQCVGPLHTPLADVAVVALSHFEKVGAAVAVGEQPIKGLVCASAGARMTVAETLTNLVFAPITDLKDVKMSGNWMWAAKCEGEGARLVEACDAMCKALCEVGCAIDGGKDSLSMAAKAGGELVKAPGTLVLSAYVPCPDITKVVTPDLKGPQGNDASSSVIYVRLGSQIDRNRLGGSALAQVLSQIGDESPDIEDFAQLVRGFNQVQKMIDEGLILAGHDVSDGGLITALLEMAFAGNMEMTADIRNDQDMMSVLFAEEAGLLLEVTSSNIATVRNRLQASAGNAQTVATVHPVYGPDARIRVSFNGALVLDHSLVELREIWEETGDRLGVYQTKQRCLDEAKQVRAETKKIEYKATFDWSMDCNIIKNDDYLKSAPLVAIIREEGSNGDREMAAAYTLAGFQTVDVTMTDMLSGHSLAPYLALAFVGGFSYADVLGSAKGWASAIRYNSAVADEFDRFRRRADTLSFGVCNGCQLMALLGWVGEYEGTPGVFLAENACGRFESTFGPVRIEKSRAVMMEGMEGSVLGLWSSHGEGRFTYRNPAVHSSLRDSGLIAVRYADSEGSPTEKYPWNPNGSMDAVAAICSDDGRHLAMMPHSDRSFMTWQWSSTSPSSNPSSELPLAPWIKMFQNAFEWIKNN